MIHIKAMPKISKTFDFCFKSRFGSIYLPAFSSLLTTLFLFLITSYLLPGFDDCILLGNYSLQENSRLKNFDKSQPFEANQFLAMRTNLKYGGIKNV